MPAHLATNRIAAAFSQREKWALVRMCKCSSVSPQKKESEAVVVPEVVTRNEGLGRRLARYEAALGLIAQHSDKLGAIVGLGAERLVRDDDRGSWQCRQSDTIEHILRDGDAVKRILGAVRVIDRDRCPTQAGVFARHRGEHMRADSFLG